MPPREVRPSAALPRRGLRVLCAEDHEQVAELIRLVLQRVGHVVDCAGDGVEALRLFDATAQPYDVLITDHVMPDLDGLGLVRALRERKFAGAVIVQSARLTPVERTAYMELGVSRFIEKPVRPETLRSMVAAVGPSSGIPGET